MKRKYEEEEECPCNRGPLIKTYHLVQGCHLSWRVGKGVLHKSYHEMQKLKYNTREKYLVAVEAAIRAKERLLNTPYFTNALDMEDVFFYSWLVQAEMLNYAPGINPFLREAVDALYLMDSNSGVSTELLINYIKKNNPFFDKVAGDQERKWRPKNMKAWLVFIKDSFGWIDIIGDTQGTDVQVLNNYFVLV